MGNSKSNTKSKNNLNNEISKYIEQAYLQTKTNNNNSNNMNSSFYSNMTRSKSPLAKEFHTNLEKKYTKSKLIPEYSNFSSKISNNDKYNDVKFYSASNKLISCIFSKVSYQINTPNINNVCFNHNNIKLKESKSNLLNISSILYEKEFNNDNEDNITNDLFSISRENKYYANQLISLLKYNPSYAKDLFDKLSLSRSDISFYGNTSVISNNNQNAYNNNPLFNRNSNLDELENYVNNNTNVNNSIIGRITKFDDYNNNSNINDNQNTVIERKNTHDIKNFSLSNIANTNLDNNFNLGINNNEDSADNKNITNYNVNSIKSNDLNNSKLSSKSKNPLNNKSFLSKKSKLTGKLKEETEENTDYLNKYYSKNDANNITLITENEYNDQKIKEKSFSRSKSPLRNVYVKKNTNYKSNKIMSNEKNDDLLSKIAQKTIKSNSNNNMVCVPNTSRNKSYSPIITNNAHNNKHNNKNISNKNNPKVKIKLDIKELIKEEIYQQHLKDILNINDNSFNKKNETKNIINNTYINNHNYNTYLSTTDNKENISELNESLYFKKQKLGNFRLDNNKITTNKLKQLPNNTSFMDVVDILTVNKLPKSKSKTKKKFYNGNISDSYLTYNNYNDNSILGISHINNRSELKERNTNREKFFRNFNLKRSSDQHSIDDISKNENNENEEYSMNDVYDEFNN